MIKKKKLGVAGDWGLVKAYLFLELSKSSVESCKLTEITVMNIEEEEIKECR